MFVRGTGFFYFASVSAIISSPRVISESCIDGTGVVRFCTCSVEYGTWTNPPRIFGYFVSMRFMRQYIR